ncbi:MAG TPA: ion transporter [Nocardioidaceae bacterium]|jgi:voltage-gated potassium channel|nr:ion transporter [Nocardioidaceae bacterium]
MTTAIERADHARERWAEELLDRLTPAMSALSIVFVLVVVGEQLAREHGGLSTALTVAGWLLWAVFAAEFAARLVVAPDTSAFFRRNWWQVIFLVLPFLRVFRLIRAVRVLRTGRVLSSAVRTARSAAQRLRGRLGWLASVTAITILGSSQLLYEFGDYPRYAEALHGAALATITGEPLARSESFANVLEVLLAAYSVVVFAALAGALGAYFLGDRQGRTADGVDTEPGGHP